MSVPPCIFLGVAHAVLDRCITDNVTEDNPDTMSCRNYEVTFDFEFIEDWRTAVCLKRCLNRKSHNLMNANTSLNPQDKGKQSDTFRLEREEEEQATKWKPEGFFKQHHPLNLMVGVVILFL